jgi:hypothetical protein
MQCEMEQQVTEEDLCRIREAQVGAAIVRAMIPTKMRAQHLRPKLHAPVVMR